MSDELPPRALARELGIALSLGGLHEAVPGQDKIRNTHVLIEGGTGEILSTYSKVLSEKLSCDYEQDKSSRDLTVEKISNRFIYSKAHLFDVEIPGKFRLRESDWTEAGKKLRPPVAISTAGGLRVGLGICYDLRFPEMAQGLNSLHFRILR